MTAPPLTAEQISRFLETGFLVVEDVLTKAQVETLAARADAIAAGGVPEVPETSVQLEPVFRGGERQVEDRVLAVRKLYNLAVFDPVMWQHVVNPAIVDIIGALLNTQDLKLYGDQLFMKAAETGSAQPWHQDSGSWRDIVPMDLVTAWTAIDESTLDNGCLHFAPGTHRWGMLRGHEVDPLKEDLDEGRWPTIAAPLGAGSVSFHHSLILHRSGTNRSARRRRGYAVHYMRASSVQDASVTDAPKMPAFRQVRGRSFPGRV